MRRQLRVAEEIRHRLGDLLRDYYWQDQALSLAYFNVTEVKISPDLKNATVFVLPLNAQIYQDDGRKELMRALNGHIIALRKELARVAYLKFVPKLYFVWDYGYDESGKIDKLLNRV